MCAKDWKKFKERDDVKVHYEEKIPIPYETRHSASYLFLDLRNESDLVLTQIDLTITNGMGGDKGIVELVRSWYDWVTSLKEYPTAVLISISTSQFCHKQFKIILLDSNNIYYA